MRAEGIALAALLAGCASSSTASAPPTEPPYVLTMGTIGDPAPEIDVLDVTRPTASHLHLAPGKVNVVCFFATWSAPDKHAMPQLGELSKRYQDRGLVILGISVDDERKGVREFALENGASFDVGWDEGHRTANRWKPSTQPIIYIVDRKGIVRFIHHGYHDGEAREIERELVSLL